MAKLWSVLFYLGMYFALVGGTFFFAVGIFSIFSLLIPESEFWPLQLVWGVGGLVITLAGFGLMVISRFIVSRRGQKLD